MTDSVGSIGFISPARLSHLAEQVPLPRLLRGGDGEKEHLLIKSVGHALNARLQSPHETHICLPLVSRPLAGAIIGAPR